jgi:hypothetical protein
MPGLQNPVLGSGAEYQMSAKGKDMDIAYAIVGKEDVSGNPGFWVEMRMQSAELGGEMISKMLVVSSGAEAGMKRMIMQQPGQPPMEMSGMMMSMMQQHTAHSTTPNAGAGGKGDMGQLMGTESITVPAGTFSCQHYRKQEQNGPVDMWISTEVTPYALVKMTGTDLTMVLKKTLTNESSHIKGEPRKMQFPGMPQ